MDKAKKDKSKKKADLRPGAAPVITHLNMDENNIEAQLYQVGKQNGLNILQWIHFIITLAHYNDLFQ
jgi:hypothetical protein